MKSGDILDKTEEKYIRLTTRPLFPLLTALSAPAVASMLITAVYNAADSYFVSTVNDSAVGSIGVVFSFMAVLQAVGFMFGHGAGNYMSRELGKKNYDGAGRLAVTAFVLSFLTGLVIGVAGLVFLEPLARFLGSTDTILPYAKNYLKYILIAAPFQTASLTLNNQLRFQGNTKHGLIGLGVGAVLNMGLDPLFISGLGMNTDGAGLATMISQIVSFVILVFCTFIGGNMPMKLSRFTLTKAFAKEIFTGGIPSLGRQTIGSVATVLLNFSLKPYGDCAIAAMTVVARITQILLSVLIGLGQGFQPVCGMNYGAEKYDRVIKAFKITVLSGTVVLTLGAVFGCVFAEPLVRVFANEDETIRIAARALRFQLVPAAFSAFYMIGSMLLQNLGRSAKATVLAVSRQGIVFLPLILVLPRIFGLTGALLCQPISDVISIFMSLPMLLPELKKLSDGLPLVDAKSSNMVK